MPAVRNTGKAQHSRWLESRAYPGPYRVFIRIENDLSTGLLGRPIAAARRSTNMDGILDRPLGRRRAGCRNHRAEREDMARYARLARNRISKSYRTLHASQHRAYRYRRDHR